MIYDGIITKPPIEEVLEHFGVKGMEWSKHKYLNKMNGAYSYGNNPSNDQKMMFEKRKKLFEMKYKNTSAPKKEGSGKISENRSKQKTSDTDKDVSPFKTMQRAYYKRYLESVGDGKAMSFDEFVRAMNERASKSKVNQNENTSKNQASINDKFKMMREIQLKKLKMKYKR